MPVATTSGSATGPAIPFVEVAGPPAAIVLESDDRIEDAVESLLAAAEAAAWEEVGTPGEGEEYRASLGGDPASALTFRGSLLHESVLA